jgi:prophage tail gpP-like protein
MSKRFITTNADGTLAITTIGGDDADGVKLAKSLFELSRTSDLTAKFDSAVHTREAIAAGITGHRALALTAECDDTDLPSDRYFRDAWEWSD